MEEEKYSKSKQSIFFKGKLVFINTFKKLYYYDNRFFHLLPYISFNSSKVPRYNDETDTGYFQVSIGWLYFHAAIYLKGKH